MDQSSKSSIAKDVFAYLLTFVMLYVGVVSFIKLLWQIIEVQFPDQTAFYVFNPYDSMRNAIASLIIVWPIFLLMTRHIVRDIKQYVEKAELWVRRWLTYLTIFVAAITMIVDLITLLNSFLSGELTVRFSLKVLVILIIAAAVFGYEFWELRRQPENGKKQLQMMTVASVIMIVVGIVAGFYFVGSPTTARDYKFDKQRVSDLLNIQGQIVTLWNQTGFVLSSLDELKDPLSGFVVPVDPETKQLYEFIKTGDLTFDLCATFNRETPKWEKERQPTPYIYDQFGNQQNDNWDHSSGRVCYSRTIDPVRHKTPKM